MQSIAVCTLLLCLGVTVNAKGGGSSISAVVKQLQGMIAASKIEQDTEKVLYAKYVCYCDRNEVRLVKSMGSGSKAIETHKATIERLDASNAVEASKAGSLFADIADNTGANTKATALRLKENTAFAAKAADLTAAIGQMTQALLTLAGQEGSDHARKMAGRSSTAFLSIQTEQQSALTTVEAYMNEEQYKDYKAMASFLQGPGGDYTAESGKVLGMIKSMKDTMTKDLNEATSAEAAALATFTGLAANLVKANSDMVALKGVADATMGANDLLLSTEKPALVAANTLLASDTKEKSDLLAACKSKAAVYDKRVSTRANEDAALAKAVEILDSDESFGSFQKTTSTKISFLQEVSTHSPHHESDAVRAVMKRLLSKSLGHSSHKALPRRLKHVMSTLAVTSNPFDNVLKEITKMVAEVDAEAASDAKEMGNCQKTRIDTEAANVALNTVITDLNGNINTLTLAIETPDTGDLGRLAAGKAALAANLKDQTDQTKARSEENAAYQQNIKNLMTSKKILNTAITVLKKFYDTLATAFIEEHGGEAPPATFTDGAYAGQGGAAGAANNGSNNVAVTMLTTIRTNTANEVAAAHTAEQAAQTAFEDAMTVLVVRQKKVTVGIEARISSDDVKLTNDRAELQSKNKDKKAAEKSLAANLALLASIKAGCDYIYARAADPAKNVLKRDAARAIEKGSLIKAERDLKNSVAYKYAAMQKVHASYGKCAKKCVPMLRASNADFGYDCQAHPTNAKCVGLPDHVDCLACKAGVPVKGYCVGHQKVTGCAAVMKRMR